VTDADAQEAWPLYSPDGRSILVHRWTWTSNGGGEGWLAVMPADGSSPARDVGPRIPGGEDTGLIKSWSPDGTRVLVRAENQRKVYSIDPVTGDYDVVDWTTELPDWQRVATD
jgi:Tol biopolymer transport system component